MVDWRGWASAVCFLFAARFPRSSWAVYEGIQTIREQICLLLGRKRGWGDGTARRVGGKHAAGKRLLTRLNTVHWRDAVYSVMVGLLQNTLPLLIANVLTPRSTKWNIKYNKSNLQCQGILKYGNFGTKHNRRNSTDGLFLLTANKTDVSHFLLCPQACYLTKEDSPRCPGNILTCFPRKMLQSGMSEMPFSGFVGYVLDNAMNWKNSPRSGCPRPRAPCFVRSHVLWVRVQQHWWEYNIWQNVYIIFPIKEYSIR